MKLNDGARDSGRFLGSPFADSRDADELLLSKGGFLNVPVTVTRIESSSSELCLECIEPFRSNDKPLYVLVMGGAT